MLPRDLPALLGKPVPGKRSPWKGSRVVPSRVTLKLGECSLRWVLPAFVACSLPHVERRSPRAHPCAQAGEMSRGMKF